MLWGITGPNSVPKKRRYHPPSVPKPVSSDKEVGGSEKSSLSFPYSIHTNSMDGRCMSTETVCFQGQTMESEGTCTDQDLIDISLISGGQHQRPWAVGACLPLNKLKTML